jgi:hypothetical protein
MELTAFRDSRRLCSDDCLFEYCHVRSTNGAVQIVVDFYRFWTCCVTNLTLGVKSFFKVRIQLANVVDSIGLKHGTKTCGYVTRRTQDRTT